MRAFAIVLAAGAAAAVWALWPADKAAQGAPPAFPPLPPPPTPKAPPSVGEPPLPPAPVQVAPTSITRAKAACDVNRDLVLMYAAANSIAAFWSGTDDPPSGPEVFGPWVLPNPSIVIVTQDGAFWKWDNGWHVDKFHAQDFCDWAKTAA